MDRTEAYRQAEVARLNREAGTRAELEERYGQVFDTSELTELFEVYSFAAPYIFVRRKADGVEGTLEFQHMPRFYFNFIENPNR
jgi:hypothetical protein